MVNLGIVVKDLSASWLSYLLIKQINTILDASSEFNFSLFFENISTMCINPKCSIMSINEIWTFSGILVSTCLDTHEMLNKIVNNKCKKVFYIWDLDWLRDKKDFNKNTKLLRNPDVDVVVKNDVHYKLFKNYANREPDYTIDNINLVELAKV